MYYDIVRVPVISPLLGNSLQFRLETDPRMSVVHAELWHIDYYVTLPPRYFTIEASYLNSIREEMVDRFNVTNFYQRC